LIEQRVLRAEPAPADVSRWADPSKTPGIQYVAVNARGTVAAFTAGSSDLRRGTPMDAATTMMAYSMSKTITAVAVLQLAERQQIVLDQAVTRYLPESPYADVVTVAELLTHTGGLPNPIPLRWVHPIGAHDRFDEEAAFQTVLRTHPRLSHRPGTRYAYSNIGYWMLGKIVERAAGCPFSSYVTANILQPLGIAAADLGYTLSAPERHASGYLEKYSLANLLKRWLIDSDLIGEYEGRWLRIRSHYPNGPAFGGLVGTARGFAGFLQDQLRPQSVLFTDATRAAFYAPQRTLTGKPIPMTLGWHVGETKGVPFFFKEGGGGGFHSMMRVYATRGVASVVMTNATNFDVAGCLNAFDRHIAG
jgi:CubicO group peptidase (beta-lactamase class C family)